MREDLKPLKPLYEFLKDRQTEEHRSLDRALLDTPSLALESARFETMHLGEIAVHMVNQLRPALQSGQSAEIDALEKMDDQVDVLHEKITEYLSHIHKEALSDEETEVFLRLMRGIDEIERIGDVVESDRVPLRRNMLDEDIELSDATKCHRENAYIPPVTRIYGDHRDTGKL